MVTVLVPEELPLLEDDPPQAARLIDAAAATAVMKMRLMCRFTSAP
jgi:hypothetical protein